ncbi:MAG: hypothetical protein Q27BB25_04480 [Blastomonas sp. CACIA14H2]|uniref:hypothetical protein n=1 Tax=Blastomonas sp. CACIA14H2 TaxID=1419876 RepID=UPI0003CFFAD1|nr:MAG: hypothetical protein Q27BB25_04480 [Blastomonas sp. CACIA14H2]
MIKALPPTALPAPMTPGTYLRKRRKAAGVSLELAAVAFLPCSDPPFPRPTWRAADGLGPVAIVRQIVSVLSKLESDQLHVDGIALMQLTGVVPFEREAYDRLVALHLGVDVAPPSICRECGCGVLTACMHAGYPCAWSETDPNLCTACERREAQAAADLPETENAS